MHELKGKRVFIVEDDATNMAVFAVTLRSSGATIIQDYWNTQVLDKLRQNMPIDVIILDLMLRHNLNGYQVYEELQAQPDLASIPVVIVSAADPTIEIPKAQAMGFAGFIGKPIQPFSFPQQIASCMNGVPVWYSRTGSFEDGHT